MLLGGEWFAALPRDWGPSLAEDQELGGALAWALGDYPIGILIFAMISAWVASDEREARRYDRRADRDGDAALEAYNAHLRTLAGARGDAARVPATTGATVPREDRHERPASR